MNITGYSGMCVCVPCCVKIILFFMVNMVSLGNMLQNNFLKVLIWHIDKTVFAVCKRNMCRSSGLRHIHIFELLCVNWNQCTYFLSFFFSQMF